MCNGTVIIDRVQFLPTGFFIARENRNVGAMTGPAVLRSTTRRRSSPSGPVGPRHQFDSFVVVCFVFFGPANRNVDELGRRSGGLSVSELLAVSVLLILLLLWYMSAVVATGFA